MRTTRRGGASSGQTLRGPIPSWDPPLSLGRFMSGGSQTCPPRFNYYTTNLYFTQQEKIRHCYPPTPVRNAFVTCAPGTVVFLLPPPSVKSSTIRNVVQHGHACRHLPLAQPLAPLAAPRVRQNSRLPLPYAQSHTGGLPLARAPASRACCLPASQHAPRLPNAPCL